MVHPLHDPKHNLRLLQGIDEILYGMCLRPAAGHFGSCYYSHGGTTPSGIDYITINMYG